MRVSTLALIFLIGGTILAENSYEGLAQHYNQVEWESLVASGIIGAGLGVILGGVEGNSHGKGVKPSDVDVAMGVKRDIHALYDISPGIATTGVAAEIHAETLENAIHQMKSGKNLTVDMEKIERMASEMAPKPERELLSRELSHFKPEVEMPTQKAEVHKGAEPVKVPGLTGTEPPLPFEKRLKELETTFTDSSHIKKQIARDLELSRKDIFTAALNCFFETGAL